MSLLVEDWVSRASALQRKGRAGRVRAGVCWGLYTRHRYEQRLRRYQVISILCQPACTQQSKLPKIQSDAGMVMPLLGIRYGTFALLPKFVFCTACSACKAWLSSNRGINTLAGAGRVYKGRVVVWGGLVMRGCVEQGSKGSSRLQGRGV